MVCMMVCVCGRGGCVCECVCGGGRGGWSEGAQICFHVRVISLRGVSIFFRGFPETISKGMQVYADELYIGKTLQTFEDIFYLLYLSPSSVASIIMKILMLRDLQKVHRFSYELDLPVVVYNRIMLITFAMLVRQVKYIPGPGCSKHR